MGYLLAAVRWITRKRLVVHCWSDPRDRNSMATAASCLLLCYHLGPHRYTPDNEIRLRFPG